MTDANKNPLVQKPRKRKKEPKPVVWQGFLNCGLNVEEKRELKELAMSGEFEYADLNGLVDDGYKVTLNYSAKMRSYVVTLNDQNGESSFAGWSLSGQGSTLDKAFASLLYKHKYKWRDGWEHVGEPEPPEEYA